MVKTPIKKYPEFLVVTDVDSKSTNIIRCSNFKTAVDMYRKQCDVYGPFNSQIFEEVVGYGEKV